MQATSPQLSLADSVGGGEVGGGMLPLEERSAMVEREGGAAPPGEPSSAVPWYEGDRGGGVAAQMAGGISGWGGTKEDSVIAQGKGRT